MREVWEVLSLAELSSSEGSGWCVRGWEVVVAVDRNGRGWVTAQ